MSNFTPPYLNYPQSDKVPLFVNSPDPNNYPPFQGFPAPNTMANQVGYPNQGGMLQPGMQYPGMQPGMHPGMPPSGMHPGMHPGMPPSGMHPGMPPPGMQPGMPPQELPGFVPSVCPTAPEQMIPGYEGLTCDNAILPPPTVPVWQPDPEERKALPDLPILTEEEVRDAVLQYASEHCCYRSKAGRDMEFKEIIMMSAFHYKLETFTEKRESAWRFEPYTGQYIDGPSNGPAPSAWDVQAMPQTYFKNSSVKIEVPHTALVKPCHTCVGNGRVRCENCTGNGRKQCTWCKGRGRRSEFDKDVACSSCNGTGWDRCFRCDGTGQVKCKTCDGKGTLKGFVELTITWTNHVDDFITETSSMPKELVLEVTGQVAYEEENPRVFPLIHVPEQAVRDATTGLIDKHSKSFVNQRILKQRQCLRVVPIGHIQYDWNEKIDVFFVYGFEHKVYFKKYPQRCLCTIM